MFNSRYSGSAFGAICGNIKVAMVVVLATFIFGDVLSVRLAPRPLCPAAPRPTVAAGVAPPLLLCRCATSVPLLFCAAAPVPLVLCHWLVLCRCCFVPLAPVPLTRCDPCAAAGELPRVGHRYDRLRPPHPGKTLLPTLPPTLASDVAPRPVSFTQHRSQAMQRYKLPDRKPSIKLAVEKPQIDGRVVVTPTGDMTAVGPRRI